MDCKKCEELIPAYLENELTEEELKSMQALLDSCPECREKLNQTMELFKVIDHTQDKEPPGSLRTSFLKELEVAEEIKIGNAPRTGSDYSGLLKIAASVALIIIGFTAGSLMTSNQGEVEEIAGLRSEVQEMKQLVMMSMLKEQSASERIQAVNLIEEFEKPNDEVIGTLFRTLNDDESPNVRLAALEGLKKLAYNDQVRIGLVSSFEFQSDPVVQIMLINLMVELEERRAAKQFQHLIDDQQTLKIVKAQAEVGLQLLI